MISLSLVTLCNWYYADGLSKSRVFNKKNALFDKKESPNRSLEQAEQSHFWGFFYTIIWGLMKVLSPIVAVIYTRITCKVRKFTQLGLKIRVTQRRKK